MFDYPCSLKALLIEIPEDLTGFLIRMSESERARRFTFLKVSVRAVDTLRLGDVIVRRWRTDAVMMAGRREQD